MKDEFLNHKDFIESLKNVSLDFYHKVYHKSKGKRKRRMKSGEKKYTLAQIGRDLATLNQKVDSGFNELRQDVKDINTRLDGIDTRLDYIVKANNLKDRK